MESTLWLIVAIFAGAISFYALFALIQRWRKGNVNYKNLYTVGMSLLPLGILFISDSLLFGGLYFTVSLVLMEKFAYNQLTSRIATY